MPDRAISRKRLRGFAAVTLAVSALLALPHTAGAVLEVKSGNELAAAFLDSSVELVWVASETTQIDLTDATLTLAASNAGVALPFLRTTNLTIRAVAAVPPLVSLGASQKVTLGRDVHLVWENLILVDYSQSLAGWDFLGVGDAATTGAFVVVRDAYMITGICYPADIAAELQANSVRPAEAPGQDSYTRNMPQPGCSAVPNAPLLQRCWADRYIAHDVATTGSTYDTVNQRQVPKHYTLQFINTTNLCRQLVDMACIRAYGAYGCVQKEYSKPLPPIVLLGLSIPDASHPAFEGKPGSTGVRVTTASDLAAVLLNNTVSAAWVEGRALELSDTVFELAASRAGAGLPFQRTANLTIRGFRSTGDPPLVILSAVSKLRLGSGVQLAWLSVVLLDYSLSMSGWEVLSAGDASTTGARVLVQDSYTIISTCYPAAIAAEYQARSVRPPEAPGQNKYTLNVPQPGCSNVTTAPLLQRCWADRYIADDLALTGATLDTVNQRQVYKRYIVLFLNTTALCRELVDMACITAYGAYGCVQKEYSKPLPPIVLPPDMQSEQSGDDGSLVPVLVGSIVGGVLGLLLLGSAVALVVVLRRRRAARAQLTDVAKQPPSADGFTGQSHSHSQCSGNYAGDDGCVHERTKLSSVASAADPEAGAASPSVGEKGGDRAPSTVGLVCLPTPSGQGGSSNNTGAKGGIQAAPSPAGASLAEALSGGCGSQDTTAPASPFGSMVGGRSTWSKGSTVISTVMSTVITEKTPFRTGVVVDMRVDRDFVEDAATAESKALRAAGCAYTSISTAGSTRFGPGFGPGCVISSVQGSSKSYENKHPASEIVGGPGIGGGRGAGGAHLPPTPATGTVDGGTAGRCSPIDPAAAVPSCMGSCVGGLPVPAYTSNPGSPPYGHKHGGGEYGAYGPDIWPPESGSSGERTDRTDGGGGPPASSDSSVVRLLPVVLGKGAAGRVYEGIYDGQRVAVKVLTDTAGLEGEGSIAALQSFQQELEVLARCEHPNIVRLLAACVRPPRPCVIMERMDTSLDKLLYGTPGTLLPLSTVLHIAMEVAQGLEYLHPTIIHRDLKPANVLLNNAHGLTPTVKISDFGLSRLRDTILLTEFPEAGTPAYIAPECFDVEAAGISHKADIYSWGVLLWEALAGVRPWQGMGAVPIAMQITLMQKRLPLPAPADAPGADPSRWPPRLLRLLEEAWDQVRGSPASTCSGGAGETPGAHPSGRRPSLSSATSGTFSPANTGTLGATVSAHTGRALPGNMRTQNTDPAPSEA